MPKHMHRWLGFLESARKDLEENKSRYFVSCFTMAWKVILIFGLMVANEFAFSGSEVTGMMFRNFTDGFHSEAVPVVRVKQGGQLLEASEKHLLTLITSLWPLIVLLVHVGVTYLCYAFAKFTCKVCIQGKCTLFIGYSMGCFLNYIIGFYWGLTHLGYLRTEFGP